MSNFRKGEFCTIRMTKEEIEGHQVPLAERMLREPFWLGLLTVFVVMMMIGIGYLLRKHLPEKLEKLLRTDHEGGGSFNESNYGKGPLYLYAYYIFE